MPDVFFFSKISAYRYLGYTALSHEDIGVRGNFRTWEGEDLLAWKKVSNARMRECKRTQIAQKKKRKRNVPKIFIKACILNDLYQQLQSSKI